jgi:hypothetical protein
MAALIIVILFVAILLVIVAHKSAHTADNRKEVRIKPSDCGTCSGNDPKCEQECMMEAATKAIEYYDDEELDRYRGRNSDEYDDDEVEEFRDILYTMRKEDVKGWNRSLILRNVALPDQLKDEVIMLIDNDCSGDTAPKRPQQ